MPLRTTSRTAQATRRGTTRRPAPVPASGAKTPRLSTRARRQQILEVALQLFAESGFKGTTTRRIADAAGVTEACIFQHFPDKDALYAAVLEHKAQELPTGPWLEELEGIARGGNDEAVVRAVFTRIVERHERDPHVFRLMVYAALENHALARRMQEAQGRRLYRFLERFVRAGQRAGRFRPGPPAVLVRAVLAQPVFYVLQRRLFRPGWPGTEQRAFIETGVSLVLSALRAMPAGEDRHARAPSAGVA